LPPSVLIKSTCTRFKNSSECPEEEDVVVEVAEEEDGAVSWEIDQEEAQKE
jgi:hypothetical protein